MIGQIGFFFSVFMLVFLDSGSAYRIKFKHEPETKYGINSPAEINTTLDNYVVIKLMKYYPEQERCEFRMPNGDIHQILTEPLPERISRLESGCGVKVQNLSLTDDGRWRLSSTYHDGILTGFTDVKVIDFSVPEQIGDSHVLIEGMNYRDYNLSFIDTDYCVVRSPQSESDPSIVSGICEVDIPAVTRAMEGNWTVSAGIQGKVEEITINHNMHVERGDIVAGFIYEEATRKLNIYCNLNHIERNITYCRFQRQYDNKGFRLVDGLGSGNYSYYGQGLRHGECGITIETVTTDDIGTWRCTLGLSQFVTDHITITSIAESIVRIDQNVLSRTLYSFKASRDVVAENNEVLQVISTKDKQLSLLCSRNNRLSYCWFKHPNGTAYTPENALSESSDDALYWSSGHNLAVGECGITFRRANDGDTGLWQCHMAELGNGVEQVQLINVRITGPIAAEQELVTASIGDETSLSCVTAGGFQDLEYCRFLLPTGIGIHITDENNRTNAINNKYFLKEGARLSQGRCAITVTSVDEEDFGQWICAAKIKELSMESSATMTLVQNLNSSLASTIGIAVGVAAATLIVAVGAFIMWRRKRATRTLISQEQSRVGAQVEESIEIGPLQEPRLSGSSAGSEHVILSQSGTTSSQRATITSI